MVVTFAATTQVVFVDASTQADANGDENSDQNERDGDSASFQAQGSSSSEGGVENCQYEQQNCPKSKLVHPSCGQSDFCGELMGSSLG